MDKDKQIENLKSVMIAAAEEIAAHWDAHCDKDGFGPVNLIRRLEEGIPAEYGYKAGCFKQLLDEVKRLRSASEWVGLTADEIWKCNKAGAGSAVEFHICVAHQNVMDFAEAIEQALKEKNGG